MFRQIVVLFVLLASTGFFSIRLLPRQVSLLLSFGSVILMAVVIVVNIIYDQKKGFKHNFSLEVILFLISAVFAMFGAKWGHGQGYLLTAWAQSYMYFYLFYFFIHLIRMRPVEFERLLLIMAGLFTVMFFIQYAVYPTKIIYAGVTEGRGTIRIFMPGIGFATLMFFCFLLQLFQTNKLKYAGFCLIYLIIVVLLGTRQTLLITLFGILVVILVSRQIKSRVLMIFLILIGSAFIFFIFQEIFTGMIEVSEKQSAQEDDDIRMRSMKFFLTDFQPNKINYIIGNGVGHQASYYGLKIWYYKDAYGFYQSDIGIVGVYSMFGVFTVLGIILMLRKIFIIKVHANYKYIKFWAVTLIFSAILGWPFHYSSSIVVLTSALYLLDISNHEYRNSELELRNNHLPEP